MIGKEHTCTLLLIVGICLIVFTSSNTRKTEYTYPEFYKGIYLNIHYFKNLAKLSKFVEIAKEAHINTFVMDAQKNTRTNVYEKCAVTTKYVDYLIQNGIHPVARIVVFPKGIRRFPISKKIIQAKIDIAVSAAENGFKEIQFDYIRFTAINFRRLRHITLKQRYEFIESFLRKAKKRLEKYNVKIAVDIFGRVAMVTDDVIGQRIEELDSIVDILCPMIYPALYGRRAQRNPYDTVYATSKKAKERTKKTKIVVWIQAFKLKLHGMPYHKYIAAQIKAVHDAGVDGFIMWNISQQYRVPFQVTKKYYTKKKEK